MTEKRKRKRAGPVAVRFPPELLKALKLDADRLEMSFNAYIIYRCTGEMPKRYVRKIPAEKKTLGKIMSALVEIKYILLDLKMSGSANIELLLEKCLEELVLIRNLLCKILWRRK